MDWERSYYTMTDPNISYIWGFLKRCARARMALPRPPLDAVVPALRHLALPARADRLLQGSDAPVAARAPAAARAATASTWWCGRRRRGRCRPTWPPPCAPTPTTCGCRRRPAWPTSRPTGSRRAPSRGRCSARCADPTSSGSPTRAVRRAARPGGLREPGGGVGGRVDGRGHRHRPHRPGLRRGGLRARPPRGSRDADPGRRGRRVHERVRLAARPPHRRGGAGDRRRPRPARRGWSPTARSPTATPSAGAAAPS